MMRHAALAMLALLVASSAAHADTPPSRWDTIREPKLLADEALHTKITLILAVNEDDKEIEKQLPGRGKGEAWQRMNLIAAKLLLEAGGIDERSSWDLRMDMARVLLDLDDYNGAIPVLLSLSKVSHPLIQDVYWRLAIAYAKLARTEEEIDCYDSFLLYAHDPQNMVIALANRAEAMMRLGRLEAAVEGYREAFGLSGRLVNGNRGRGPQLGLAVALDRLGATREALEEAKRYVAMDPRMEEIKDEFFVPSYETHYYEAVAFVGKAASSTEPFIVHNALLQAELKYKEYITKAQPNDQWLFIAKKRLATVTKKRLEIEATLRKLVP